MLVIGCIGRFDQNKCGGSPKGYAHILYEAVEETDWWLILAGPGAPGPPPELDSATKDHIRVHPVEVSNPADWYRALDVFVLPSKSEGFPLCISEALLCGCRVASTRVSDLEEVFSESIGFFDYGDVAGMRNAIRCAPSPEAGQVVIARELTVERMIDQYEEALG